MVSMKLNLVVDFLMLVSFLVCVLSGFFMRSMGRDLHVWSAWVLIVLVVLHLVFHFTLIKNMGGMSNEKKKKN